MISHPETTIEKKSDSPDEDKCVHDAKLLISTQKDFLQNISLLIQKHFLVMQCLTHVCSIENS